MHHPSAFAVFGGATVDHAAATSGPPVMQASNPGTSRSAAGGVGLNVARVLARLGRATRIVSVTGADADGAMARAAAVADGVAVDWLEASAAVRTATYRAAFDHHGELIIGIADMAAFEALTPEAVSPAVAVARSDEAFVLDANLPADTLGFLVSAAGDRPVAAIAVSPAKAVRLMPFLGAIDYLFATRREAAALLGRDSHDAIASRDLAAGLAGRGVGHVIVTDSANSVAAAFGGDVYLVAPFPARLRSVNGAGDALAGGTLHGLATGRSFLAALSCGLAAAAITVEHSASVATTLDLATLDERMTSAGRA